MAGVVMLAVLVDPVKEPGIIVDRRAERLLAFLEKCAGAPEGAVALLFPKYAVLLKVLRGSGYVRRCWKPGKEPFWCPANKPLPTDETYEARCALGWFACRLYEAGGRLEGKEAAFRTGRRLPLAVVPPKPEGKEGIAVLTDGSSLGLVPQGWYYVAYGDLRERRLKECLKKKS
ncbi:MAG: hypothetical protein HPY89_00595 [Pelotomaculum sp.]|nr:hypothetical protein [Pelotomaculum sp.]